jgi:hypothetical protein
MGYGNAASGSPMIAAPLLRCSEPPLGAKRRSGPYCGPALTAARQREGIRRVVPAGGLNLAK